MENNRRGVVDVENPNLERMDGGVVSGSFTGRVRKSGKKTFVDVDRVDVKTKNTADVALSHLTRSNEGLDSKIEVDDEDDI